MKSVLVITLNPAIDITYRLGHLLMEGVNRVTEVYRMPGGKGVNVLRVLQALGAANIKGTGLLAGGAGDWLEKTMAEQGIPFEPWRVEGETRSTIAVIEEGATGATEFIEPGPIINEHDALEFLQHVERLISSSDYILLSGSQPKGLPPDYVGTILDIARRHQCFTGADISGEMLNEAMHHPPDLVKVNAMEFADWLGECDELDSSKLASESRRLVARGAKMVVVTMGAKGSIATTQAESWWVSTPAVDTVNPVGSGDAFFAGLIHGLACGASPQDSLAQAAACGASNATFPAAGCVRREHVQKLSLGVTFQTLSL